MKRMLLACAVFCFPFSALAQNFLPVVPSSFDLSGSWIIDPVNTPSGFLRVDRCDRRWSAETNWPLFSGARFELRATGESRIETSNQEQRLHLGYTGILYFPQGFASSVSGTTPEGLPGVAFDYECHVEIFEYTLTGELTINLDTGDYSFSAYGPETSGSPFRKGSNGFVSSAYYSIGQSSRPLLFIDPSGDVIVGSVGTGDEVNQDTTPDQCSTYLRSPFTNFSLSQCLPLGGRQMTFRRTSSSLAELPRGTLRGHVVEGLPDGTPTANPITRGQVLVYRQDRAIRPQAQNESDESYAAYLEEARADRPLVAQGVIDANGEFAIADIPIVRRTIRARDYGQIRQVYAVEIVGGEIDEIDPMTTELVTVHFARQFAEGLVAERDQQIVLRPNSALLQKVELTHRLIDKTPDTYTDVETEVLTYLAPFVSEADQPSPAENEGISRAIWAERAVAEGTELADALTSVAFDVVADFVADMLEGVSTRKQEIRDGREKLSELRERRNFQQGVTDKYSEYSPFNDGPGVQRINDEMNKLLSENPMLLKSEMADLTKKIVKLALIAPVKTGLTSFGMSEEDASAIATHMERFVITLIDRAVGGDLGDALRELVKFVITSERSNLIDAPLLPFSVGARVVPSLEMSRDRLRTWSVDNRPAYRVDRDQTADLISQYTTRGSQILAFAEYAQAAAEGLGASSDAFELGQVIPAFRVAQKVTKAGQRLAQAGATIVPITYALAFLPSRMETAAYAAYGQTPPMGVRRTPFAQLVAPNSSLYSAQIEAMSNLLENLTLLNTMLSANNYPNALFHLNDPSPAGVAGALKLLDETHEALLVARAGAQLESTVWQSELGRSATTYLKLRLAISELAVRVRRMIFKSLAAEDVGSGEQVAVRLGVASVSALAKVLDAELNPGNVHTASVTPAIAVTSFELASDTGSSVTTSPQTFTLTARIRNVSSTALTGLSAELVVSAPIGEITVTEATMRGIGSLDADDNTAGGTDEVELVWTVERTGSLERVEPTGLQVRVLENGVAPLSFVTRDRSLVLALDDLLQDADQDGMPDDWERMYGLDPAVVDDRADLDNDGIVNIEELRRGTHVGMADTDGDGLSDGEEISGGQDGWVTNPKNADTDGDSIRDGDDGSPLDIEVSANTTPPAEPIVQLSTHELILTNQASGAVVEIANAGGSTLTWTALVEDDGLLLLSSRAPSESSARALTIALRRNAATVRQEQGRGFVVRIVDVGGATTDEQQLVVWIGERGTLPVADGGSVATGEDAGETDDAGVATTPGAGGGDTGEDGGCGCATHKTGTPSSLLLFASLAMAIRFGLKRRESV